MKQLSRLKPAETLILLSGDRTPMSDLLKYTLLDLLLKQVLVVEEIERQPNERDPVRTYKYVGVGKNFNNYLSQPHESVFLLVFERNNSLKILFRNLVRIGFQEARSERLLYYRLISNKSLDSYFHAGFVQKLFGWFSYTPSGLRIKEEVEKEILELEKDLPEYIATDSKRALEDLKMIGGNIFLLRGLQFDISNEIDKEIFRKVNPNESSTGCSSGCWPGFTDFSHSFDSSCSSDSSSAGGDGGCSGCSGCGGCGGD